jgi:hypothetical protein
VISPTKNVALLLAALFVFAGCTRHATPEARFILQEETPSPRADFFVGQYVDGKAAGLPEHQLWIREKAGESYLLFRHFRVALAVVSPDENYLVINDRRSREEAGLFLYGRERDGRFVAAPRVNVEEMVWRRFYQDLHWDLKKFPGFHHAYAWCPRWIDDSSFEIRLQGYGDDGLVEKWAYSYDVRTNQLAPDPQNSLKWVELPGQR